ncbi:MULTISPECIES: alpha/beta fold hydrolase [Rhodopseudomonas]|uniref:AB hydrolase-1 domain-containing protein n=1 Tax=Rhodopseudomonas palustris TaxID=1076 RepID=A0A0D7ER12_RHOPL|nr:MULTISPECIES: alpha/beta fold hydrolase [Rhodopseudomonas]KIZ41892.1 hypothetical protein OO17_13970 [Rhodopseudomonas palustris]MDF3812724.1 alpha/beta fold hydrolase [Rhodopseudomonas sp. BAL398]WOK15786.1 alpha/beta fold hydrolase [Rhodopseudomonas sp. BAL398]
MPLAQFDDVAIHYEIAGAGEPVLLVAGLGGVASYWAPNVDALAKSYQLVLHDHRGTGRSTRAEMPYSVELLADDLLRLMDALKLEKAHLVGHSTGGAIGIVLGAKAPERIASLVLYATWAELDAQMEQCLSLRRRILGAMGEAEYHRATPLFLYPPYYVRDHKADLEREVAAAVAATPSRRIIEARAAGIMAFDGTQYLAQIRCPTTVLVAEDDILTPPYSSELIAARVNGAKLVKVPRGGHAYSRVEPVAFNEFILRFLAAHPIGANPHA